jgi:hypothetical protein
MSTRVKLHRKTAASSPQGRRWKNVVENQFINGSPELVVPRTLIASVDFMS